MIERVYIVTCLFCNTEYETTSKYDIKCDDCVRSGNNTFYEKPVKRKFRLKDAPKAEAIKSIKRIRSKEINLNTIRFKIFERDNFCCTYCGRSSILDGITLAIDHVVPISKEGSNKLYNLTTCCSICNSNKNNIILSEEVILKIWARNSDRNKINSLDVVLLENKFEQLYRERMQ